MGSIGLENTYEVAISNDVRGAADSVTHYLWIPRTAGEVQSYSPTLTPGETVYVGVSADEGLTWSEQEATVTGPDPKNRSATPRPRC